MGSEDLATALEQAQTDLGRILAERDALIRQRDALLDQFETERREHQATLHEALRQREAQDAELSRYTSAVLPHELARIERLHNAGLVRLGIEEGQASAGREADAHRGVLLRAVRVMASKLANTEYAMEIIGDQLVKDRDEIPPCPHAAKMSAGIAGIGTVEICLDCDRVLKP